ncbi:hypothetical protein Oter_1587 [Opitutus terrae PB90-1]|uniref:Uncharacterized protein n=1 Tax=Opitutus terrae (strain DSM 11246 / JCM 15787 / PB90-1) TaxID=452637 RepID=B1ZTT5_OPITP|nr:hypothetical protein Oter_1587 [Opitutus terrae PB90-1]
MLVGLRVRGPFRARSMPPRRLAAETVALAPAAAATAASALSLFVPAAMGLAGRLRTAVRSAGLRRLATSVRGAWFVARRAVGFGR